MSVLNFAIELDESNCPVYARYRIRSRDAFVNYRILMDKRKIVADRIIKHIQRWKFEDTGQMLSIEDSKKINSMIKARKKK